MNIPDFVSLCGKDGCQKPRTGIQKDALSDSDQQLTPEQFESLMIDVRSALAFRDNLSVKE